MLNLKTGKSFADAPMTRRNVLTGLGGIIAAGCAPSIALGAARIVSRDALAGPANARVGRGMMRNVGARNAAMFGGGLTAMSYVQDGLIAQWDGIENVAYEKHDESASTWNDLKGGRIATLSNQSFGDKYLHVTNGYASIDNGVASSAKTAEVVMRGNLSTDSWAVVYNEGAWQIAFNFGRERNFVRGFFIASNGVMNVEYSEIADETQTNYYSYALPNIPLYFVRDIVDRAYFNSTEIEKINWDSYCFPRSDRPMIGMSGNIGRGDFDIFAIRFYSKTLSATELMTNYAIDKARFGIV